MNDSTLARLWEVIEARKSQQPSGSYTVHLLQAGEDEILKKIGEEAIEVIVAAKGQGDERVVYEIADLCYHVMMLLAVRGQSWHDVAAELERRLT
ncbi:MAG: phosphoribosyl-ATP diphosphatase [Caldilineales bacterium]